jgi:hypothetical protein
VDWCMVGLEAVILLIPLISDFVAMFFPVGMIHY